MLGKCGRRKVIEHNQGRNFFQRQERGHIDFAVMDICEKLNI